MTEEKILEKVVEILKPYAKDPDALASVSLETNILSGLKVNSARLVDVVLAFEDAFGIEVADEDADTRRDGRRRGAADPGQAGLAVAAGGPARDSPRRRSRAPQRRSPDPGDGAAGAGGRWRCSALVGRLAAPVCAAARRPGDALRLSVAHPRRRPQPRALYARLLADRRPLLVVANHLTMVDSALIGWGLGSAGDHVLRHRGLPWNVPRAAPRRELLAVAGARLRDEVRSHPPRRRAPGGGAGARAPGLTCCAPARRC